MGADHAERQDNGRSHGEANAKTTKTGRKTKAAAGC